MNKRVIAGIIAAIVAVALVVSAIVITLKLVRTGKKDGGAADSTPTTTVSDKADASATSGTDSTASGQKAHADKAIEKGSMGLPTIDTKAGDTFEVPFTLKDNPGIAAGQFYFTFDSKALTYVGYDEGDILDEYDLDASTPGKVSCIIAASDVSKNVTRNGTLITLKFKANADAAKGEYAIKLTDDTMICNIDEQTVTPTIGEGKVVIK